MSKFIKLTHAFDSTIRYIRADLIMVVADNIHPRTLEKMPSAKAIVTYEVESATQVDFHNLNKKRIVNKTTITVEETATAIVMLTERQTK